MNKENLNEYILVLYNIFKNNSFEDFVVFFHSYNTANNYNKDISDKIIPIYNKVVEIANKNFINYSNYENESLCNVFLKFKDNSTMPKIKVFVPLIENNINIFCDIIIDFIIKEEINITFEFLKRVKTSVLCLEFDYTSDFKKIIRFLKQNRDYLKLIKNKINPFIPIIEEFGLVCEYDHFNYLDFIIINLVDYFSLNKYKNKYDIESFCSFISDKVYNTKYLSLRRMYIALYRCLKCIKDDDDVFDVFAYDANMNISSVSSNDYNVKFDKNRIIYFVNIFDKREVILGDEFYLNIAYSKFYNISIEMSESKFYYDKFYFIYNKLLENNFNFNEIKVEFESIDDVYKQLLLLSSGFFALKKMGFRLDEVYNILKILFLNHLGLDFTIKKKEYIEEINEIKDEINDFPFDEEFSKSVFSQKNGDKTTVIAYFKMNKVLDIIPIDSKINMKNGSVISGKDFLEDIKYIAYKYDSFNELVEDLIEIIEY